MMPRALIHRGFPIKPWQWDSLDIHETQNLWRALNYPIPLWLLAPRLFGTWRWQRRFYRYFR